MTKISIRQEAFHINGRPTYEGCRWQGNKIEGLLMNARLVQGIFDDLNPETKNYWCYPDTGLWDADRNTVEFIDAMDSWRRHGLLCAVVNLQGGSPEGYSKSQPWHNSAIRRDGSLREDYMERLGKIIRRADELGMVVMVGIFYFGQMNRLDHEKAVLKALRNTIDWIAERNYENILLEIANECNNSKYLYEIIAPARIHEIIQIAREHAETRNMTLPVSVSYTGGKEPGDNVLEAADYILLHGNGVRNPDDMGKIIRSVRHRTADHPKPIVVNEDDSVWRFQNWNERNNMTVCIENYASWGYFDFRQAGEGFDEGFQSVPVNWQISSERKRNFFELLKEITYT